MNRLVSYFTIGVLATTLLGCDGSSLTTEAQVLAALAQPRTEAEQTAAADEGRRLFLRHSCHNCHVVKGATRGAPRLSQLYTTRATLADGQQIERDRAYLARSILSPQDQVVAGYAQPMSRYAAVLTPAEVAALILYLEQYSPPGKQDPMREVLPNGGADPDP